jgi:hypothetical protein
MIRLTTTERHAVRKLRLDADTLRVEPFETGSLPADPEGTVHGRMETRRQDSCGWSVCCPDTRIPQCSVTGICA